MNGETTDIRIVPYTRDKKEEWDNFVADSRNGTFLFMRDYMEYHADRFTDHSLMAYREDTLQALLPANINDDTLCSHGGLTYGGLIIGRRTGAATVLHIFAALRKFLLTETEAKKILYRPVPHIYHKYPCEEELYALFRCNAQISERKISSAVWLREPLPFSGRRKLTATRKRELHILEDENFAAFWSVLDDCLRERHAARPVHTLKEITALHAKFPDNIILFRVTNDSGDTLCGVVIYLTGRVAHAQYTATTAEGRRTGALDHLYEYLLRNRFAHCEYFDFGTSVEDGGRYLNSGLISQKEGFGGRAVVYDTYILNLNNIPDD